MAGTGGEGDGRSSSKARKITHREGETRRVGNANRCDKGRGSAGDIWLQMSMSIVCRRCRRD